jgi:hypothetical protein
LKRGQSAISASITCKRTTSRSDIPCAASTLRKFSKVWRVWPSSPPAASSSVCGLMPSIPDMMTSRPIRTPSENGSPAGLTASERRISISSLEAAAAIMAAPRLGVRVLSLIGKLSG